MNKKRVASILYLVIASLLIISLVSAQNESTGFELGYECLEDQVTDTGAGNLQVEEQVFALLALAYDSTFQSDLKSALESNKDDNNCWPKGNCNVKDTALALIALDYVGEDIEDIVNWLTDNTDAPTELIWYLQIDQTGSNEGGMECDIVYQNSTSTVEIGEDRKISGSAGTCLRSAQDGYWLEVDNDCYDKGFDISCDDDFVTALIYKRRGDEVFYVSSLTHAGILGSTTTEEVNSLCFKDAGSCDYESSLWATLALRQVGEDYEAYIPYLISLASDNSRYLPSAFLYMILGYDEYFDELINEQQPEGYWQSTSGKRYYDTALALMALQGVSAEQKDDAIDYLTEGQPPDGCWSSLRDTAFILYAASPKSPSTTGSLSTVSYCEEFNYYCTEDEQTCLDAGGDILDNYQCDSWSKPKCCSVNTGEETCAEKDGVVCQADEDCSGNFGTASDTSYCCLNGICTAAASDITECENAGYSCKTNCGDDEEEKAAYTGSCPGLEKCCGTVAKEGRSLWWIWLLVLLIILLVLAIIFRNQLKVYYFKVKSKFKKKPVEQKPRSSFPGAPTARPGMRAAPRRVMPAGAPRRPGIPPKTFKKEKELSSTINQLKKMGK